MKKTAKNAHTPPSLVVLGICLPLIIALSPLMTARAQTDAAPADDFGPLVIRDGCASKHEDDKDPKNKMSKMTMKRDEKPKDKKKIRVHRNFIMSRVSLNKNDQSSPEAVSHLLKVLEKKKKVDLYEIVKGTSFVKSEDIPVFEPYSGVLGGMPEGGGSTLEFEHGEGQFAFDVEVEVDNPSKGIEDFLALYMLIIHPATLNSAQKVKLREYLLRGGFLFADANCGNTRFYEIFKKEIEGMFPGRRFEPIPAEHPLFRCFYNLTSLRYYNPSSKTWRDPPKLEGLRIGCRMAVILSPYCYSCGWDRHVHDSKLPGCIGWIDINDSIKLGINMLSYAMEYRDYSKPLMDKVEMKEDAPPKGTDFVIARLKFDGEWDPDPNSGANLLRFMNKALNADFYSEQKDITLAGDAIFEYPFVYLTGHGKVNFSERDLSTLKQYLLRGGTLFADACCGDKEFRESFESLITRIFGHGALEQIPQGHPIYSCFYDISDVAYTKHVSRNDLSVMAFNQENVIVDGRVVGVRRAERQSALRRSTGSEQVHGPASFMGVNLNGRYAVVYSRLDMGCAWKGPEDHGVKCGFCKGIEGEDSYKAAANVIVYALTK